jgi:ribosome recycling factor
MVDDILIDLADSFENSFDAMRRSLNKVRTGRANLAVLDDIRIDYYGSLTPLNQVATLTVADPRLITIKPWENTMIPVIEKTINQADIGINPSNDGEMIRLPIPPLSGERRQELVRQVRRSGEECKQSLRGHRRDANEMLKEASKEGEVSEDERDRGLKRIQDATDQQTKAVDDAVATKETELLEV